MATVSLTLPISCQICLGKVKDPVICPNNHAFCKACLDMWLKDNTCCPTCRIDITKDMPYRKVIGSSESNETLSVETRKQLRRTRLELIGGEYETEIEILSLQLNLMTQENEKLKKQLKSKEEATAATVEKPMLSSDVKALSSLTRKLQEIGTTYDDVRRDMTKLQQEKEQLQQENNYLKSEVSKLKDDSLFTKSPKRFEKFTITGLKAKVEQYEKENQQLKKALQNSDKYVEQLQAELSALKNPNAKGTDSSNMIGTENGVGDGMVPNISPNESASTSMVVVRPHLNEQFEATVASLTPLNRRNSSEHESCTVTALVSVQNEAEQCGSSQNDTATTPTTSEHDSRRDLFPATKKLLALKKIHERRGSPSPPSTNIHHVPGAPAINPTWPSSAISYLNYDGSNETQATVPQSSENFSCSFPQDRIECSESSFKNVILTAAGPWPLPSSSFTHEETNIDHSCKSPKRNTSAAESCLLNKKIKVEQE